MIVMEIKLLGLQTCRACSTLEQLLFNILAEMDLAASVEKVHDREKMIELGVTSLPALIIDGEIKCSGRIPKKREIIVWLQEAGVSSQ